MTSAQLALLLLLIGLLIAFAVDRFRIEVVALTGLAAALLLKLVPASQAFSGFSSSAVITVAELLILTRLLSRSYVMDRVTRRLTHVARSERSIIALVCSLAALTSVFVNNIGALALWLPVGLTLCRLHDVDPRKLLMPLSFATLLGGTCSLIGTPANLVISNIQSQAIGRPLGFFDSAWPGVPMTIAGLVWLVLVAPRILASKQRPAQPEPGQRAGHFFTELTITPGSALLGTNPLALEERLLGRVHGLFRDGRRIFGRPQELSIEPGDVLLVEADAQRINTLNQLGHIAFAISSAHGAAAIQMEVVVLPQSVIIGSSGRTIDAFADRGVAILAMATRDQRPEGRLADLQIRSGDVLLLEGEREAIQSALSELGCLSLAPSLFTPARQQGWPALLAFAAGIVLAATGLLAPELAFGAAVLLLTIAGKANLRELLVELNWPILLMLAAMIPIGQAVETTGLAHLIADHAVAVIGMDHQILLLAAMLFCSAAITPFVNNVSAAAALAPIAAAVAKTAGVDPTPFLLAVTIGVSLDFLAPFGHHNNALVMSLGDYRFSQFPRLGLPLLLVTATIAILAIRLVYG